MKRKSLMLLFSIPFALALAGIAACEEECTHTYADTLSSDSEYHWYAATCEHTDMKGEAEPHKDANDDGVCDVCGYDADHVHTYEETLTINQTHHWYATTCTHDVPKDKAEHVDENNDGECDVCKFDNGHVCEYATTYTTSETQHWLATTCGHAPTQENHVDADNSNECDVCGYDYVNVTPVVESATTVAKANLISSGTMEIIDLSDDPLPTKEYEYAFGANYTYATGDYAEYHYSYVDVANGDDIFLALQDFDGDISRDFAKTSEAMAGLNISHGWLPDSYTGVETFVSELYTYANADNGLIYNYVDGYEATEGIYYFNFFETRDTGYAYQVMFKLSTEGALDDVAVLIEKYSNENWLVNTATKEILFTANATPSASYVFAINQTIGARTAVHPYADEIAENMIDELAFVDADGQAVNATVEVNPSIMYVFPLADNLQDSYAFNQFALKTYKKVESEWIEDDSFTSQYRIPGDTIDSINDIYADNACVTFKAYNQGEYKVVVSTELCEKEIVFNCVYADPETLTTFVNREGYDVESSSATVYTGMEAGFMVRVNAGAQNGQHQGAVTSGQSANSYTLNQDANDYYFTATEVGTYVITISSTVQGFDSVTTTFTVNVIAPPTVEEIMAGRWGYETYDRQYNKVLIEAEFTFGNETNTAIITYNVTSNYGWGSTTTTTYNATFTVDAQDNISLNYTGESLDRVAFYIVNYQLCVDMGGYGAMNAKPMVAYKALFEYKTDAMKWLIQDKTANPWTRNMITLEKDGTGKYEYLEINEDLVWVAVRTVTFTYALTETETNTYTIAFSNVEGEAEEFDATQGGTIVYNADEYANSTMTIMLNSQGTQLKFNV